MTSFLPSPSMSEMASPSAPLLTGNCEKDCTPSFPIKYSDKKLLLILHTATSLIPSLLRSPTATLVGPRPVSNGDPFIREKFPLPSPNRIVSPSLPVLPPEIDGELITARSRIPSLFKSSMATPKGTIPASMKFVEKLPCPSPNKTVRVLASKFVVTISALPSLFKSAVLTL